MRWILCQEGVEAAIVGATSRRHLESNIEVFRGSLGTDDQEAILSVVKRSVGPNGDVYDLERDKSGRHGSVMRYNQNSIS